MNVLGSTGHLVTEINLNIVREPIANLKSTLQHTQNIYKTDISESTDVDQLKISVSQLKNTEKIAERGSIPREASIYATNEVWLIVIVLVLTIVAVIFPMTMVSGMMGVMFQQLG
jgi:hypothetical protein